MTKLRNPLFGLKAHGSLGNTVTFQKRGSSTFARRKPIPIDPQSDPQLWHRGLYLLFCQYWNGLSVATKQQWESDARRSHITGFNLFMRTELDKLDQVKLYLPLNEGSGSIATDFSGNRNHGVIYGASWVDGKFGKCLSFDGVDDHVTGSVISAPTAFTLLLQWKRLGNSGGSTSDAFHLLYLGLNGDGYPRLFVTKPGTLFAVQHRTGGVIRTTPYHAIPAAGWNQLGIHWDGATLSSIYDGEIAESVAAPGAVNTGALPYHIGWLTDIYYITNGLIDEPILYNRALTATEIAYYYNRKESS